MKTLRSKILLTSLCSVAVILTVCASAKQVAPTSTQQDSIVASANEASIEPSASPQKISPSEAVKVRASEIKVRASSESAEAVVEIVVADGFRINTNPASSDYLIATELKIEPATSITIG